MMPPFSHLSAMPRGTCLARAIGDPGVYPPRSLTFCLSLRGAKRRSNLGKQLRLLRFARNDNEGGRAPRTWSYCRIYRCRTWRLIDKFNLAIARGRAKILERRAHDARMRA